MKFWSLLSCIMMVGCLHWEKGGPEHQVVIDSKFTNHHKQLIVEGCQDWEVKTNYTVTFKFPENVHQEHDVIWIRSATTDQLKEYGDHVVGRTNYGLGDGTSNVILLNPEYQDDVWHIAVRHELGHALGLGHDRNGTVMASITNNAAEYVTCQDVAKFCEVWDCQYALGCLNEP